MTGTNNLQKNIFLALIKTAQIFHYFCKVRACRISVKNSILQKLPKIVETLLLMRGTNNLQKNIFLAQFKIAQNFHYFCKVEFPSKIQFSKNCRLWKTLLLMRGTNNLQKNIFLAQFKIAQNFHYFCKVRACGISVEISIFQKLPKIVEKHFI